MDAVPNRILFIDDDPEIQDLICEIFDSSGFEVEFALNGREGVAQFDKKSFQAVITDLWMPVMDGISTVVALRARDKHVPIVLISGLENKDEFISAGLDVGADCILKKPFSHSQLLTTVKDLLDRRKVEKLKG